MLPTILSRTQRFDFRRIAVPEIVDRLREICAAEGIAADDESLVLLARKGDGALRDALSLFDQAVSLCGADLQIGPLREALGVVDADVYFETTARARRGDRAAILSLVDHVVRSGHDLNEFVLGLADHLRNLLVARATGTGDLIEGTEATRQRYVDAAAPYAEADLLHLLMLSEGAATDLRESRQPRLTLELALLKMASLERAADLGRLLDRLAAFETAARGGTLPPSPLTTATLPAPEAQATPPTSTAAPAPAVSAAPVSATPAPAPATPTAPRAAAPSPTTSAPPSAVPPTPETSPAPASSAAGSPAMASPVASAPAAPAEPVSPPAPRSGPGADRSAPPPLGRPSRHDPLRSRRPGRRSPPAIRAPAPPPDVRRCRRASTQTTAGNPHEGPPPKPRPTPAAPSSAPADPPSLRRRVARAALFGRRP